MSEGHAVADTFGVRELLLPLKQKLKLHKNGTSLGTRKGKSGEELLPKCI